MKIYAILTISLILVSMSEFAGRYPTSEFTSPVNRSMRLSGTFGELRTNHFHAGLDIKSQHGTSGDPIYAAYDGFVSRIRVDEFGYGNALYVEHPNGFTSLYGHLDRFAPEIEAYVKAEQYKAERFEVDLYPRKDQFPVDRNEQIGVMGNTGYSFGPHLHFEIRHTDGQVPVNPLHFGYNIDDTSPPVIQQLLIYEYDESGSLLQSKVMQPARMAAGHWGFDTPIETSAPKVSFAIRTYDTHEGTPNQNGVYSIQCKVDQDPSFAFTLDEIPFEQSRYLNAHIDYKQKIYQNRFFHRCHPLEGNKLPIYYTGIDNGMIHTHVEMPRQVTLEVADFNGNMAQLRFDVKRNPALLKKEKETPAYQVLATPDQVATISRPGLQIVWPKGSFYETTPIQIETIPSDGLGCFSPHYSISPADVPVHYYFDVFLEGLQVPAQLRDKVFIARCEPDGDIINCGGTWIGNNLTTGVRQMATYTIMADTIAPKISTLHFGPKMTGWNRMAFKISDNFRIRDRGRDLQYDAWVDGKWILMSLDGKTGILTHLFDGSIPPGEHQLRLKVTDDRGNEAVLEKTFIL